MEKAEYLSIDDSSVHEKSSLVPQNRRVSINTAIRLRKAVIAVSIISIIAIGALGALTLVEGIMNRSSACFAFAFNAFLDILSAIVIIWHFLASDGNLYSVRREAIACIILGCFFFLSAFIIMGESIYSLALGIIPKTNLFSQWSALINIVVCSVLLVATFYLAVKLESKVLFTDAFNTVVALVLAISTVASDSIYHHAHDIWQIDGIIGVVCSLSLIGYGIWVIYMSYHNLQRDKAKSIDDTSME